MLNPYSASFYPSQCHSAADFKGQSADYPSYVVRVSLRVMALSFLSPSLVSMAEKPWATELEDLTLAVLSERHSASILPLKPDLKQLNLFGEQRGFYRKCRKYLAATTEFHLFN